MGRPHHAAGETDFHALDIRTDDEHLDADATQVVAGFRPWRGSSGRRSRSVMEGANGDRPYARTGRAPRTLGVLAPLYGALDLEAIGDWMKK